MILSQLVLSRRILFPRSVLRMPIALMPRLCIVAVLLLCGCSSEDEPADGPATSVKPFAGQTVRVAVPGGLGLNNIWDLSLSEWSGRTGAEYELVTYTPPADGNWQSVAKKLSGQTDVLLLPASAVSAFDMHGGLATVPLEQQSVEHLDLQGYPAAIRDRVVAVARQPRVLPVSCPVLACYYRADLLAAAELTPPATWDEYQELLETLDNWAPGMTAVEPWSPEWRATTFLAKAVSLAKHPDQYSFAFDVSTGRPLIDGPGFVAALEQSQAAVKQLSPESLNYSPADCRRELLAGRAALGIALETDQSGSPLPFGPAKVDATEAAPNSAGMDAQRGEGVQLGIVPLPGSQRVFNTSTGEWAEIPLLKAHATFTGFGGLTLVVAKDSAVAEAAWNLIESLAVEEFLENFPAPIGGVVRDTTNADGLRCTGDALTDAERFEWEATVRDCLSNPRMTLELPVAQRQRFRDALTTGLTRALTDGTAAADALADVAKAWNAILAEDESQAEEIRRSYARRLNVSRD